MTEDPLKENLMNKLRKQLMTLEKGLASLEAQTTGIAKAEVMALRKKKDAFDREIEEVDKAGDEVWQSMIGDLRRKAADLKESFERAFAKRKP